MALHKLVSICRYLVVVAFSTTSLSADELSIQVVGLFKNTAIVIIDDEQRVLKVNQPSPEGLILKSADSKKAIIEHNGQLITLTMNDNAPTSFSQDFSKNETSVNSPKKSLNLLRQPDGMYRVRGTINNISVMFLVDTGATSIAMNHLTAQKIGVPFRTGEKIRAATASGIVEAFRVNLSSVRVGDLELKNVEGAVIVGSQPDQVLLGMSFLGQFKIEHNGANMIIEPRL